MGQDAAVQHARGDGLVLFAGAGLSRPPPSSLPSWNDFNAAVLQSLTNAMSDYMAPSYGEWTFENLVARRDATNAFAPDFMADIIAEEVGLDYFRVLQALDADACNDGHRAVAALAASGAVRAIVTTNFDRLLEGALRELQVPHSVFATPDDFERLREVIESAPAGECPVIKVHGTVEHPESMVDTLGQRLRGRPEALDAALGALAARHHFVFVGFSGADLDYDSHYLGLRDAADDNRGFTFLVREGGEPRTVIAELAEAWGPEARFVSGSLPGWLLDLAREAGVPIAASGQVRDASDERRAAVEEHARRWADSLGRLTAVNILVSLLRASGDDATAARVLFTIWRHYRRPEDCQGTTYARYNQLAGSFLLEYGYTFASIRPPTSTRIVQADAPLDRDQLDNAFNFTARAAEEFRLAAAWPCLAACYAYKGEVQRGFKELQDFLDQAKEYGPLAIIEGALAGGLVWSLGGAWSIGLEVLRLARDTALRLGMETRRARLCAHLVRFLSWTGDFDQATARRDEGLTIARRLGMLGTEWDIRAAYGQALAECGRPDEAVPELLDACAFAEESGRVALRTQAALALLRAAWLTQADSAFERAQGLLGESPPGFRVAVLNTQAELALTAGDHDVVRELVDDLRRAADETHNPWGQGIADWLVAQLAHLEAQQPPG